ncbi:hypothetical protein [Phenylobacterium sp.]|uniref:hypothetical protein n=1 Tax=Phenylobacterium sp. TaxID=1871053 RepID=UPI0025E64C6C|nr:hypothetical protein [Phenylobacterium sp.]
MTRAISNLGTLVVSTALLAAASAQAATVPAHAAIVEASNVKVEWALAPPSVKAVIQGADFLGNMPSLAIGLLMPRNARLTLRREDETGATVTAPAGFVVVTTEGGDALIVRTGADAERLIARQGAIVAGSLAGRTATSIDVARGGLTLISTAGSQPPAPAATLVVTVQYN